MTVVTPATGTWTVPAGVTSIDALAIGGGADYANNGNVSSLKTASTTVIVDTTAAKAGNDSVNPGIGGQASGTNTFGYAGGNGGAWDSASYGGGGGGAAGSGGAGNPGSAGDPGGQVGGDGGGGGASGNGFTFAGGSGGKGQPTAKGGNALGAGNAYGGGSGGSSGSGKGGGGGGSSVRIGFAVTPGDVLTVVVAAAAGAYGSVGLIAISYTAAAGADAPLAMAPRIPPPGPADRGY